MVEPVLAQQRLDLRVDDCAEPAFVQRIFPAARNEIAVPDPEARPEILLFPDALVDGGDAVIDPIDEGFIDSCIDQVFPELLALVSQQLFE